MAKGDTIRAYALEGIRKMNGIKLLTIMNMGEPTNISKKYAKRSCIGMAMNKSSKGVQKLHLPRRIKTLDVSKGYITVLKQALASLIT